MFIRWLSYKSSVPQRQQRGEYSEPRLSAILVESVRIDGLPRQRHIACLASVRDIDNIERQLKFWESVTRKLDALGNRMTPAERAKIEAQIARKVPCPAREEYLRWKIELLARWGKKYIKPAVANWPA